MKNLKNIFTMSLLLIFFSVSNLFAQNSANTSLPFSGMFNVSWQPSVPFGSMNKWIDKPSYSGMAFEGMGFLTDNIAIGGEFSWNYSYKQYDNKTYDLSNNNYEGAITGVQYRSSSIIPFLLKGYYYFDASQQIKPYVAIGLGMANMQDKLTIGIHQLQDTHWGFSSTAEVGANFLFSPESNVALFTAIKYSYSNIDMEGLDNKNISRLNFNLGLTFLMYD